MKGLRGGVLLLLGLVMFAVNARAGDVLDTRGAVTDTISARRFEVATETAYMVGTFGNPNSYEVAAQFVTLRMRISRDLGDAASFFHGFHQAYFLVMAEPIIRGPENFYYGISAGLRYNFLRPGSRWAPYISGGVGLGWIDSHANIFGAQGQDFTFNILSAVGMSYKVNERWQLSAGVLYEHLSNAGQTDPNPSLNLLGPQVGVTLSF